VVKNDSYFITVLRYIHQNPIKAGLCKKIDEYKWTSYHEYINSPKIIDTDFLFGIMNRQAFIKYCSVDNEDSCLEIESKKLNDEELTSIIKKIAKIDNMSELQQMERLKRNSHIRDIKEIEGVSMRQIARVSGLSRKVVEIS